MLGNALLLGDDGYQISRSVRLRSSASAYFNRTIAASANPKAWTWSAWIKRGQLGSASTLVLYSAQIVAASSEENLTFTNDTLRWGDGFAGLSGATTAVFRDTSAWYHVVVVYDSANATAANRLLFYVNGVLNAAAGASIPLNRNSAFTTTATNPVGIGRYAGIGSNHFDGYLTEINFIDGQALTPSSFGETDIVTGVWKPKKYVGTYGTNGFYLNFSDNSAATAATIGKDYSGNGNNWTPNNISVTAGATYDSMLDVPTPWPDGGNGRGNYPVMNPLDVAPTESSGRAQILDGNLRLVGGNQFARGWLLPTSGQWYWEITLLDAYNGAPPLIWGDHGVSSGLNGNCTGVRLWANTTGGIMQDGTKVQTFSTWANNDIIGLAYDAGTRSMSVYLNGTQLGTSVTANATDKYIYSFMNGTADTSSVAYNFGQRPFSYTPPSGFRALNTQNLPTPTILKGNQFFDATTYTGTNSTLAVTNSGGFQPDLVWIKNRSLVTAHMLQDAVRGATAYVNSNATAAENTNTANNWFRSFDASGFTVSNLTTGGTNTTEFNNLGYNYVGWQWKRGAMQGFDIVTFSGTGGVQNISHSLGVAPRMIFMKRLNGVSDWVVGHNSLPWTQALTLNSSIAVSTSATAWNNTAPTSSQFTVSSFCVSGGTYVAYLFAEVAGFSRFGSYTGNGAADGPFVFCGFRPRFVMVKQVGAANDWGIFDSARNTSNAAQNILYPNLSNAESAFAAGQPIDFLSNGFKLYGNNLPNSGTSGTYIFAAFAEVPFKYALAR